MLGSFPASLACVAVILQSVPRFNPQLFRSYCVLWAQGDLLSSGLLLLDRGADVNAKDLTNGQNALMFAAANGRTEVVKLLVSRGAELNALTSPAVREQVRVNRIQLVQ